MTSEDRRHDLDDEEVEFLRQFDGLARTRVARADCPPFDLIVAAAERVLPDDVQERVSAHLAACADCRALARDAADVAPPGLTAEEDARIVARLRGAWNTTKASDRASWSPLLALAATVAVAIGLGAWALQLRQDKQALEQQVPRLQQQLRDTAAQAAAAQSEAETLRAANDPGTGQLNVAVIDLEPIAALRSQPSADRVFEVPGGDERVTLILATSGATADRTWELQLLNESGIVVWKADSLRPGPLRTFNLLVPASVLPNGTATLRLYAIRADGTRSVQDEYRARFVKR